MITIIKSLPQIMITCLLLTIIIEVVIALILGVRDKKDLLNIVLVNILTNPLVVVIPIYFNYEYGLLGRNISLFILEILAFAIEGLIYIKVLNYKRINGLLLSLILNLASYFSGVIYNLIIYGNA